MIRQSPIDKGNRFLVLLEDGGGGMGLKGFLQGKWLGHPLHPALVHVPVGLWPGALLFDLLSLGWREDGLWVQISFYAIALGLGGAVVSMAPGFADWSGIKREKPAWKLGLTHMILNLGAAAVWAFNLWIRWPHFQEATRARPLEILLSVLGVGLLLAGAWFGKRMVFDQGTSVARLSKNELRKRAEKGKSALPEE
jgi:uncharacterized membrane protein